MIEQAPQLGPPPDHCAGATVEAVDRPDAGDEAGDQGSDHAWHRQPQQHVRRESDFFNWIQNVINGGVSSYRTDLMVMEYHITDEFGIDGAPSRILRLREAWPSQVKPMADKEATASEVGIQELTLAVEELDVEVIPQA